MYPMWISNPSMSFHSTKLNPNYSPEDRFQADLEWKQQGEQADLHAVFPPEFHGDLKHDIIHTMFKAGMDAQLNHTWHHQNCHVHIGWTQNTDDTTYYNPFVPILYCNFIGGPQVGNLFLNQVLLNVFLVIIWGPGALDHDLSIRSGSKTMDQIWGLMEITPGAIAASTILVCFALSEDALLQPQGSVTKIDCEVDFHLYLKFLISGLTASPYSKVGTALVGVIEDVFQALAEDSRSDNEPENAPNFTSNLIAKDHPQP
ncbi:hypothetical protein K439DRAFT_1611956 [Ramaria rubella]|nr:hypothetical protein K439DRAFT_1611956 [Ramaria rubella]